MPASIFNTDKLKPCRCGFQPTQYEVWYGRTPYDIICRTCKKQSANTKYRITGWEGNLFDYWNNHVADMTVEELNQENAASRKERDESSPYGYTEYTWYWWANKPPTLTARERA